VPASLSGNAVYIRCFVSATYGLEWTFNAKWVSGAWAPDYAHSSTYCTRQTIDSSSFNAKWHAATGTWNDAAWTSLANFTQAGGVSFPSSGVSALGELTGLHLIGTATTPTVTPNALGSGTGATATVTGNDICGRIALTTGTNMTTAPNNVLTVTLGSAYTNKPIVLLQNLSSVETNVYVDDSQTTTNTFTLKTTGVSLTSGSPQSYGWGYHILGR
jgi:hypothetical protein